MTGDTSMGTPKRTIQEFYQNAENQEVEDLLAVDSKRYTPEEVEYYLKAEEIDDSIILSDDQKTQMKLKLRQWLIEQQKRRLWREKNTEAVVAGRAQNISDNAMPNEKYSSWQTRTGNWWIDKAACELYNELEKEKVNVFSYNRLK